MSEPNQLTKIIFGIVAAIVLMLATGSASAQRDPHGSPQDYADCQQGGGLARGIAACTRIAGDPQQSAAERIMAYRWLGSDYLASGALDDAIRSFGDAGCPWHASQGFAFQRTRKLFLIEGPNFYASGELLSLITWPLNK